MGEKSDINRSGEAGGGKRRLSAVMFTDIKDFTAMMESDEVTAVGLVKAQREIIREQVALHDGEERETIGDAFLVIFESAVKAVECAIDIQNAIWKFNSENTDDRKVWVRIGIHLGDILIEEGSIFGEGVNLAARIQALSRAGGVCITQQVYDQIKHRLGVNVSRLETRDLKNISDVPALYHIDLPHALAEEGDEAGRRLRTFFQSRKNIAIVGVALSGILAAGLFAWTYFGHGTIYSRQVSFVRHIPNVSHRVSWGNAREMNSYYELVRRDGHVVRMEKVIKPNIYPSNVSRVWNLPLAKSSKRDYPIHEYKYSGDDVVEESVFDIQGDLQYKLVYSDGGRTAIVHSRQGFIKSFENQISGFGYEFDKSGRVIRKENRNAFGSPRSDYRNVVEYRYEYNDDGLVISESAFDAHGNAIDDKNGISSTKTRYNSEGLVAERTFYDRFGAIQESVDGYAITSMKYDGHGRLTIESYADRSKRPVQNDLGICATKYFYDGDGKLVDRTTMSCSMHPKAASGGYATVRFEYDGNRVSKQSFFDHAGKPTVNDDGVASISASYDGKGYIDRLSFSDISGNTAVNKKQFHAVRYLYDGVGRPTSRMFYGPGDAPTIALQGFAEARLQYGDRGNPKKLSFMDASGKPVNSRDGYAIVSNEYDQFGNLTAKSFFDRDESPAFGRDENCHKISYQYDEDGDLSEIRCFDGGGALTAGIESCAIRKYTHDHLGLRIKSECYVDEGVFVDLPSLPSMLTTSYDKRGYVSEIRAFAAGGKLAERYDGAAIMKMKNDDRGNSIEVATYDRFGNPINNPKYNAAIFHQQFDDRGNVVMAKAFDVGMKPTKGIWGFAEIHFGYDAMDRRTSEDYIGVDGKPAVNWRGVYGRKMEYDDRGRTSTVTNVGIDGKPFTDNDGIAITQYIYDEWDQLSGLSFENADGSASMDRKRGCSTIKYNNDDRGNVIEIRCFDAEEKICKRSGCISITEQSFDARGRLVSQDFKGADGGPMLSGDGVAGYTMTHDLQGRIDARSAIGLEGKPARDKFGVYAYSLHYRPDRDENLWFMTFRDKDGKRSNSSAGAAIRMVFFDKIYKKRLLAHVDITTSGEVVLMQCFDAAGNPVSGQSRCVTNAEIQKKRVAILPVFQNKNLEKKYE
jgi:YD repeat-containing protein